MRRHLRRPLLVGAALLVSVSTARATFLDACCACVPQTGNAAGEATPVNGIPAFFCGEFDSPLQAEARCTSLGGSLLCVAELDAQVPPLASCADLLRAEEGIACPSAAGAPVSRPWALAGLAAALLGAGLLTVRRQARG